MYIPPSFAEPAREVLLDFIEEHGFATILSWRDSQPIVSHVPLLIDRTVPGAERLLGHLARGNGHWEHFGGGTSAIAIFQGPHAYISPSWYSTSPSVPTWNYAVVHVYGKPRIVSAEATKIFLRQLIAKHEEPRADRWPGDLPAPFVDDELRAIVGFEIPIDRIEGKFKLSQNRSQRDREGVLMGLEREPDSASRELAAFSRRYFEK